MYILVTCRKIVSIFLGRSYRPELHYMRGAGPKWFERHGRSSVFNRLPTIGRSNPRFLNLSGYAGDLQK